MTIPIVAMSLSFAELTQKNNGKNGNNDYDK